MSYLAQMFSITSSMFSSITECTSADNIPPVKIKISYYLCFSIVEKYVYIIEKKVNNYQVDYKDLKKYNFTQTYERY